MPHNTVSLRISGEVWLLTRVERKKERETLITAPSRKGHFDVICLKLATSWPKSRWATILSSAGERPSRCLLTLSLVHLGIELKETKTVVGKVGLYGAVIGNIFRCDQGSNPRVPVEILGHNRDIKIIVEVRKKGAVFLRPSRGHLLPQRVLHLMEIHCL
jgi:hypothetical protein